VEHAITRKAGEESALAEAALSRGVLDVVAVGGDGTWSNVANAILRSGRPGRLGLIAAGTGCDLAKSLGIPGRDVPAAVQVVLGGHHRVIDVGRVEERFFLNVVGFGFDIAVIEDSWKPRPLPHSLVYLYCALRQIYAFRGFAVEMEADGGAVARDELLMLIVANARVFGGGFQIAPTADLQDGQIDAMAFTNMSFARRLAIMTRLMRGTHEAAPEVRAVRSRSFRLRFAEPPAYETDGEWNRARTTELRIETVPGALRVMVPVEHGA
jgi:diacylglycerol kinase (ATP)